jgi:azurin
MKLISQDSSRLMQATAYAAVMTAEQSDQAVWGPAQKDIPALTNYLTGISLLVDQDLKASFYPREKSLAVQIPQHLAKKGPSFAKKGISSPFYPVHALAYSLIIQMPGQQETKASLLKDFITYLQLTPESEQSSAAFAEALGNAKRLVPEVPGKYRPEMLAALDKMGTMEIKLLAVEAKMAFDKNNITVPAGKRISLVFENPDLMPHNVVIVKPGSVKKVGEAADAMASLKDGFEKNFVPAMPEVLFATPLVNSGKSYRLNFKAPEKPGDYPFICSFPGHWRVMQGVIKVRE